MWRRETSAREKRANERTLDPFHRWILSLPWVVERPFVGAPRVRTFAVECEPLGIRQVWLVTGHTNGQGVAVIVPVALADDLETAGRVRTVAPMPVDHVLARVSEEVAADDLERIVIAAYSCAIG